MKYLPLLLIAVSVIACKEKKEEKEPTPRNFFISYLAMDDNTQVYGYFMAEGCIGLPNYDTLQSIAHRNILCDYPRMEKNKVFIMSFNEFNSQEDKTTFRPSNMKSFCK